MAWGDSSVYLRLHALTVAPEPLLRIAGDRYELTPSGQSLLKGEGDYIAMRGGIDSWFGGVHLLGHEAEWRWNETQQKTRASEKVMKMEDKNRSLMWHGMFLFLLGLISGFVEQKFVNPRMGLAAHLEGVMLGTFLIALGRRMELREALARDEEQSRIGQRSTALT